MPAHGPRGGQRRNGRRGGAPLLFSPQPPSSLRLLVLHTLATTRPPTGRPGSARDGAVRSRPHTQKGTRPFPHRLAPPPSHTREHGRNPHSSTPPTHTTTTTHRSFCRHSQSHGPSSKEVGTYKGLASAWMDAGWEAEEDGGMGEWDDEGVPPIAWKPCPPTHHTAFPLCPSASLAHAQRAFLSNPHAITHALPPPPPNQNHCRRRPSSPSTPGCSW